jgi:hypothetical protein
MVNQAKLWSYQRDIICTFGIFAPQTHGQYNELDMLNNTAKWPEAKAIELGQL